MGNKRKREETNDSDSEEITPGKQILPVANLPHDFDQEPQDGLQYLFLVRRDARRLPHVTRVRNPYEMLETIIDAHMVTSAPPPNVLPCEEWRVAFQTHFSNLRRNLTQPTTRASFNRSGSRHRIMPEKKDRDAWWKFLAGYPESTWSPRDRSSRKKSHFMRAFSDTAEVVSPDAQSTQQGSSHPQTATLVGTKRNDMPCALPSRNPSGSSAVTNPSISSEEVQERHIEPHSPPEVTPTHLQEIDHRMSMHLLMYFIHWINLHLQNPGDPGSIISSGHGRWIFALLAKVENQLSADEMNLLRNLARACLGLIQSSRAKSEETTASSETVSGRVQGGKETRISDASCWIVFAAIAGHWGQRDLWMDAEAMMAQA